MKPSIHQIQSQLDQLHAAFNAQCASWKAASLALYAAEAERDKQTSLISGIVDQIEAANAALAEAGVEPPAIPAELPDLAAAMLRGRASGDVAARLESKALPRAQDGAGTN